MTDDPMDDEAPIDLRALMPDAAREERFAARMRAAAAPELARRRAPLPLLARVDRWRRPVGAVAALAATLALWVYAATPAASATNAVSDTDAVASAVGVPAALSGGTDALLLGVPTTGATP
ncbi:MAG: hypothetical protein NW201_02250 [Gemmatimonadales bacterium]|nr:hypothetical protein [Gemmatimonadales bacterium]